MNNGFKMYQTNQVVADINNASKKDLLLMLYDGIVMNLTIAKDAIINKNISLKLNKIDKTLSIIEVGLLASLDYKYSKEVATSLEDFYNDAYQRIVWANLKNDVQLLEEIKNSFVDLKKCWQLA